MIEDVLGAALGAEVLSLTDQNQPDLRLPCGSLVEVKASSKPTTISLKSSLEARGANGKGGTSTTMARWNNCDWVAVCHYRVTGAIVVVEALFLPAGPINPAVMSVPWHTFRKIFDASTPGRITVG